MPITDAEVIRYTNEVIRPMAERMRALDHDIQSCLTTWFGTISAKCPNDSSALDDGREVEGVSRLTGADINNLVTQLSAYKTQMDGGGVRDVVSKPCVRSLAT